MQSRLAQLCARRPALFRSSSLDHAAVGTRGPGIFVETARELVRLPPEEKVQRTRPASVGDDVRFWESSTGHQHKEHQDEPEIGEREAVLTLAVKKTVVFFTPGSQT
jgi:hypothetical protein